MNRIVRSVVVGYFAFLIISWNIVAWAQSDTIFLPVVANAAANDVHPMPTPTASNEQQVLDLVTALPLAQEWLGRNPGWQSNVYQTDETENIWQVDFCTGADCDNWLGYGKVNLNTGEVIESFFTRDLTTEEFAAGKPKLERYVQSDPEVQGRLSNPDLWYHEVSWNRWVQQWEVNYSYGLDAFTVRLYINEETGKVELDSIFDPNEMDAQTKENERLDKARQLIWEADGVGDAVEGHDTWKSYVEHQSGNQYTVALVADGQQLFSALVDVEAGTVLDSGK
ncbi:MAG: hypothetical protein U0175_32315 [Caldilineaceae bacterium]